MKHGGTCIAGREFTRTMLGPWIRPVSSRSTGELSLLEHCFADYTEPSLLDVIDIHLLRPAPHLHQTENHLVDTSRPWSKAGRVPFARVSGLVERPTILWANSSSSSMGRSNCVTQEEAAFESGSLYLVQVKQLCVKISNETSGRRRTAGIFTLGRCRYELSITDPIVCDRLQHLAPGEHEFLHSRMIYLCISLGEPFKGRCYKLIAGVITDQPL
jgi:hypothetical protein